MATSQRPSLLPGAENHRHGRVSGDDGEARIVRTFHARFGSVKLGGAVTARTRIAYVHREGKHAGDAADVEATAGDKEKVIEASDRIRDTARVRRGKTAERLLATQVIELPLESTAEQRQACADAFVADWRGRGHQAVAVVHVHGEEHKQPHLHVEIAARPVHADGSVDRSATRLWAGGHPAVEVKKERARAADIVNRTCEPDPPYHPGGFRDIGVERQPRTRIPAGKFRKAREEIRDARAADDTDGAARIEAKAYAVSDEERGEKREARLARTAEIIEFKAAGLPPRPSQRARLAFAEPALKAEEARAEKAEASVRELEAGQVEPLRLTDRQRGMLVGVCGRKRIDGDIGNDARVQLLAFAALHEEENARLRDFAVRHEEENARKRREAEAKLELEDEAGRALTAAKNETATLTDEKRQAETRADTAETSVTTLKAEKQAGAAELATAKKERADAKDETAALRAHSAEQTKFLTGVHRENGRDLPDLETGEGRSEAWAFARAEMESGRAARRREAAAAEKRKEREAAASAERQRQAAATQAEEARQQALAENPYRDETEKELRVGWHEDVRSIEMHQGILRRARARKVWPESEEAIAKAGERQNQRRAVAEAKGWNIGQPISTQSNTQRGEGR